MSFIIILFIGIALILLGILYDKLDNKAQKRCSDSSKATICGYRESLSTDDNGKSYMTYAPVYEYTYNGELHTVTTNSSSSNKPYPVGMQLEIFVNPLDPEEIYFPAAKERGILKNVFILGGVLFIIYSFTKL